MRPPPGHGPPAVGGPAVRGGGVCDCGGSVTVNDVTIETAEEDEKAEHDACQIFLTRV